MITFTGVTKRYPDGTVAVDDLTLEVPDGCLTVFVGPSGCGKTTSMRMINRMVEPTSGVVAVDGRDVAGMDPVKLRLGVGYVIQSGGLMPHQRVIDNVATVPVLLGKSRRAARLAAYEVLERVGLDPKLGERYPAQLSGGQQQRVGVARALAADPPILLMDEPFSAVDPVVRDELQAEILRLQSELRKTIVFVTHDIDEAIKLGDAVAVFGVGGALQQYDSPSRLLSNPANDFVAEFIGADRGYRLLQFFSASTLDLRPIPTVAEGEIDGLMLAPGEWRLVTTDSGTPFGWIDADGVERHSQGGTLYDSLTAGGSLFHPDGTLRSALDAALSSPSGIGVAVDTGGVVVGGTAADDVVDAMESQRQESQGQESRGREAPEESAEEQAAGEDVEPAEMPAEAEADDVAEPDDENEADDEEEPESGELEAEPDDEAEADDEPKLTAGEDPQPAEKD
jgi:osmoprotectant transport system ATP-binding protein